MVITTSQKGVKGNTFTQYKVTGANMKPVITNDHETAIRVQNARNRLDQKRRMRGIPKNPMIISLKGKTPKLSIPKRKPKKVNLGSKVGILG